MSLSGKDVLFEVDPRKKLLVVPSHNAENASTRSQYEVAVRGFSAAQRLSGSNVASLAAASVYSPPALSLWRDLLTTDLARHVMAGTVARTLAQCLVHPIDTVKTRLQAADGSSRLLKWQKKINKKFVAVGRMKFRNLAYRGPRDVYLGLTGSLVGTIPVSFVYFTTYENVKMLLAETNPNISNAMVHLTAAATGAIASSIVRVPSDTLRHKVQAYVSPNVVKAAKDIVKSPSGVKGLYAGYWPTLIRDVPEIAIQFYLYEQMRLYISTQRREGEKLLTYEHLVLGGLAGSVAAVCTMPIDVIKTRLQVGSEARASIASAAQQVYAERGMIGFFTGVGPRIAYVAGTSAMFFVLFEQWKMILKKDRKADDKLLLPKIAKKPRDHIWKRQFVS